ISLASSSAEVTLVGLPSGPRTVGSFSPFVSISLALGALGSAGSVFLSSSAGADTRDEHGRGVTGRNTRGRRIARRSLWDRSNEQQGHHHESEALPHHLFCHTIGAGLDSSSAPPSTRGGSGPGLR